MKILQVSPYPDEPGGVINRIHGLADEFTKLGDDVTILGPGKQNTKSYNWISSGTYFSIPLNGDVGKFSIVWPPSLKKFINQFDVIDVHEPMAPVLTFLSYWLSDKPMIATSHAMPLENGAWNRFLDFIGNRNSTYLTRLLAQRDCKMIAVSQALSDAHYNVLKEHMEVVPNGIDLSIYQKPIEKLNLDGSPKLLYLGRMTPRKGIDILLDSFGEISKKYPDAILYLAGDGPLRPKLENQASIYGNSVRFLGQISDEMKLALYQSVDLCVFPAHSGESFGIILLEVMASQVPFIAAANPGYASVIPKEMSSVLFKPNDKIDLCSRLESVLLEYELRKDLIEKGYEHVKQYDWPIVAKSMKNIYLEQMKNPISLLDQKGKLPPFFN